MKAPVISELDTTELAKLLGDDLVAQIEFRRGRVAELLAELNRRLSGGVVAGSSPASNGSGGAIPPASHGPGFGKRHVFRSDEEKAQIIEYSLQHSIAEAAEHFGVPEGTISGWRSKLAKNYTPLAPAPVRQRRPFDPEAARDAAAESAFPDSVQKGDSRRIA